MILEGDHKGWELLQHRRVPYDCAPLFDAFQRQRFVERCGVAARLLIEEFRTARMRLYPFIVWKQRHHAGVPDSIQLCEAFLALDDLSEYMPPVYRELDNVLFRD